MDNDYLPQADSWERITAPGDAGFSATGIGQIGRFASQHESDWPPSLFLPDGRFVGNALVDDRPPHDKPLGEVRPRGPAAGLLLRHGRIVTEWGDTGRPDTSFSMAKSYLSLVTGIAVADGLIASIDHPVRQSMPPEDDAFDSPENRNVTWRHLLNQTSEWHGSVWGIPDEVDRNRRFVSTHQASAADPADAHPRPGQRWEYNDVRINRLALCLLQLFRRPLPDVLRERIMDPVGASHQWQWLGYRNSIISIDGHPAASVAGGSHWGGGLFMSARDHARVGLLVLRNGNWRGRQLIDRDWIGTLLYPCELNPQYGCLWWLNRTGELFPSAPASSAFAIGGGTHLMWIDPEHDIVMVARWIDHAHCDGLIKCVLAALA